MKNFDRQNLAQLRSEIDAALKAVAAKNGISLSLGPISFTAETFKAKVNGGVIATGGTVVTQEAKRLEAEAQFGPLCGRGVGFRFDHAGDTFELTGYASRRGKFPLQAKRLRDGRGFKFPISVVASAPMSAACGS